MTKTLIPLFQTQSSHTTLIHPGTLPGVFAADKLSLDMGSVEKVKVANRSS